MSGKKNSKPPNNCKRLTNSKSKSKQVKNKMERRRWEHSLYEPIER